MQNLTQLKHFLLVAREGSFARAAELANLTQPALSNSIRSLEQRLGFKLFERSERPVTLTPEAKSIVKQVEAVLFEARNLDQTLDNLAAGQHGHIRLGMTAVFSTALGGPIIAEWHKAHPDVTLELVIQETPELIANLRDDAFDLIVGDTRDLREDVDDLDMIELPPMAGGAFCRAGHPILSIRRPQPADLAPYRFAGTHFPSAVIREFSGFLGGPRDPRQPFISVDSHNIAALRDAVSESDLILLTVEGTVRNALSSGVLRQIPVHLGIDGVWSVATRRGRVPHSATATLINKITEIAQREYDRRPAPTGSATSPVSV
ncbi:LysR family transcriptional regulator [Paracoccus sp. (in: a-proteobacteria)]|uniref:LysR family transcriptional regulator n=1 Tax=Paracoccus sp. TaxID=267 RepID=UPI0035ADE756